MFIILLILFFQKKPVVQIKAASALNRIMVLIDNTLSLLNMFDLEVRFTENTRVRARGYGV